MPALNLRTQYRSSLSRGSITRLVALLALFSPIAIAQASEQIGAETDYPEVAAAINSTMRAYHYNPKELDTPEYLRIEAAVTALGESARSGDEFIAGFREIWSDGPFSHVTFDYAQQSASDLADFLDSMRVGGGGATLSWRGDVAILTVNTMMGLDTIEEIDAAYEAITDENAAGVIIDLRENHGGAFAVRPLVAHLLAGPVDAGVFVSQPWNRVHDRPPARTDLEKVEPWTGWSIKAFWADVQTNPVTRVSFSPVEPVFAGPAYVLTSRSTASAAELAVDVLKVSNRVTIIGERTAGQMLSQTIFDIPGGFHLSLPIADYYSAGGGRIEGAGIEPDIAVDAADALGVALQALEEGRM